MSRDTRVVVDLRALAANLELARQTSPGSRLMAVIKANAYGHGLLPAARALAAADGFAVTCLSEAIPLREAGFEQPILLLQGAFAAEDLAVAQRYRLDVVVHSLWQVELLEQAVPEARLTAWLKVDSGMHRLGLPPAAVPEVHARLRAAAAVGEVRLMTHLAAADDRGSDYTRFQLEQFELACDGLGAQRSIGNSAGLLAWPAARSDWVRPGIMLYGVSPFADGGPAVEGLVPAMTLSSRLIAINHCRRGDRVGYAGAYTCPEGMPVGVVTIGYGDGYPRHAGTGTPLLIDGVRSQVLGRVSMDMLCVDLRPVSTARVGSEVVLWGRGLPVEEVASHCGTIAYELLCKLTARVPFEYRD